MEEMATALGVLLAQKIDDTSLSEVRGVQEEILECASKRPLAALLWSDACVMSPQRGTGDTVQIPARNRCFQPIR